MLTITPHTPLPVLRRHWRFWLMMQAMTALLSAMCVETVILAGYGLMEIASDPSMLGSERLTRGTLAILAIGLSAHATYKGCLAFMAATETRSGIGYIIRHRQKTTPPST